MRRYWLLDAVVLVGVGVLAVVQVAATVVWDEPVATFTRDTIVTGDLPWYAGSASVLTGVVWGSAGALALLVALLAPAARTDMLIFAAFMWVLGADDMLVLHETVGPSHGVPEFSFMVVYAVLAILLLARARRRWDARVLVSFVAGGGFLALSVLMDELAPGNHLIEDGAKLLGAMVWSTVPVYRALATLGPEPAATRQAVDVEKQRSPM